MPLHKYYGHDKTFSPVLGNNLLSPPEIYFHCQKSLSNLPIKPTVLVSWSLKRMISLNPLKFPTRCVCERDPDLPKGGFDPSLIPEATAFCLVDARIPYVPWNFDSHMKENLKG